MIKIRSGSANGSLRDVSREMSFRNDAPIVIGLVNNMPDAALQATERQFCDLMTEAARDLLIWVSFFSTPERGRTEAGQLRHRKKSHPNQKISRRLGHQVAEL